MAASKEGQPWLHLYSGTAQVLEIRGNAFPSIEMVSLDDQAAIIEDRPRLIPNWRYLGRLRMADNSAALALPSRVNSAPAQTLRQ
jgi:hypothetical protein